MNKQDTKGEKKKLAIKKWFEIGGRFWCWHDYVKVCDYVVAPFYYNCCKCGKRKVSQDFLIERININ